MRNFFLLVLMLAVVVGTQYRIVRDRADVVVSHERLAGNPVTRYAAVGTAQGTVLVAHGFASNKTMLQYWGFALARQGFDTYLFDQPGHGEQVSALPAWEKLTDNPLGQNLRGMVTELVSAGRARPGKIALVGHSMGGITVIAAAMEEPAVAATVGISAAYWEELPADRPANFLSLVAERDPASIRAAATSLAPQSATRKTVDVGGQNHMSILYDQAVLEEAAGWIHQSLGTTQPAPVGPVAPWGWIMLALAAGLGAVPAAAWLLKPAETRSGSRPQSLGFFTGLVALAVAAFSAVLATVYLRIPWVGLAMADYLVPYFLVAAAVLFLLRWLWPRDFAFTLTQGADSISAAVLRGLGIALAYLGAVVPVIHMNLSHQIPNGPRILPLLGVGLVLWLYFAQEEGLKRAVVGRWGSLAGLLLGVVSKLVIIGTWLGATALPNPPTYLVLTIPVTMTILLLLEPLGALLGAMRYSSATVATLNAVVLAWAVAVTFPLV